MSEITLRSIDFNFEQLKSDVEITVKQYVDFKVTSGTISDAKKIRAELNSLSKTLSDKRIELKNAYMIPVVEFESKIKLIDAIIKDQVDRLDRQVKSYEDAAKEAKKLEIDMFYSTLNSPVDIIKIWNVSWLNATTSEKQWKTELTEKVNDIKEKLALIPMLKIDDQRLLTNLYLESLDLTKAQTTYESLVKDVSEQTVEVETYDKDEPLVSTQFEILGTQKQIDMVINFMKDKGITFMEGIV